MILKALEREANTITADSMLFTLGCACVCACAYVLACECMHSDTSHS